METNINLIQGLTDAKELAEDRMVGLTISPSVFIVKAEIAAKKILKGCRESKEQDNDDLMKKTFEQSLQEKHVEENSQILDDNLPDSFERWLEQLSTDELIKYADEYVEKINSELKQIVIEDVPHQYQDRLLKALK